MFKSKVSLCIELFVLMCGKIMVWYVNRVICENLIKNNYIVMLL